jgi:hypothetical protein
VQRLHENLREALRRRDGQPDEETLIRQVKADTRLRIDPFIACFSSEPDLIGMWAYFSRDGGYNIGFRRADLTTVAGAIPVELRAVIYKRDIQTELLESALRRFEEAVVAELSNENEEHQERGTNTAALVFWTTVRNLILRMKAPGFEGESEWRLLTLALEGPRTPDPDGVENAKHMSFRTVGSRIVPYMNATYGEGKAPVVSITSGPSVDAAIARDSVQRILKRHNYPWRDIVVNASSITLRPQ